MYLRWKQKVTTPLEDGCQAWKPQTSRLLRGGSWPTLDHQCNQRRRTCGSPKRLAKRLEWNILVSPKLAEEYKGTQLDQLRTPIACPDRHRTQ
jgi:hypothetical protein